VYATGERGGEKQSRGATSALRQKEAAQDLCKCVKVLQVHVTPVGSCPGGGAQWEMGTLESLSLP
jgi:hypothetical protein